MKINLISKNPNIINAILEIRLCQDTWKKIKHIATEQRKSYSWVVRYSIFRQIKRKNPQQYMAGNLNSQRFERFQQKNKRVINRRFHSKEKHRHKLCLYGEDELFIRLTAVKMGCTMTHLIRLCLEFHLDSIIERIKRKKYFPINSLSNIFWTHLGKKMFLYVKFPTGPPPMVSFIFEEKEIIN